MSNTHAELKHLESIALPKWPQMLVWGSSVTEEQAKEIILRTDSFLSDLSTYSGGNNRTWEAWARDTLGYTPYLDDKKGWQFHHELQAELRKALGFVKTDYVRNDWAACAFIFGPHGWCSPNGRIWFGDNVGSWPCAKGIFLEWGDLAEAFPFLDLTVTLMSGESCEEDTSAVVSFKVKDGAIQVLPEPVVLAPECYAEYRDIASVVANLGHISREQGLPDQWIKDYGVRTKALLDQVVPQVEASIAAAKQAKEEA